MVEITFGQVQSGSLRLHGTNDGNLQNRLRLRNRDRIIPESIAPSTRSTPIAAVES